MQAHAKFLCEILSDLRFFNTDNGSDEIIGDLLQRGSTRPQKFRTYRVQVAHLPRTYHALIFHFFFIGIIYKVYNTVMLLFLREEEWRRTLFGKMDEESGNRIALQ